MGSGTKEVFVHPKLLLVTICAVVVATRGVEAQTTSGGFKCSTEGQTCRGLVDYSSPNKTTLDHIQSLFNVEHLLDIVAVNGLPATTPSNHTVAKGATIKIPFPCKCSNGTGLSNQVPIYVIVKDDTLSHIALEVFSGLVTYQKIEEVNNITNPTTIQPVQRIWIPLPCSCDKVNGTEVVHYGYLVPKGSTVQQIAQQYGTTQETLLALNGMSDPKSLLAGQILDVPLKACSSSTVRSDSLDSPLLVANGTDTYTANGCVKCSCDYANNATLQCEPSQLKPYNWASCPSVRCENSSAIIGNVTSTASCSRTLCAYAGYNNQTIFTTLATESTCPAPPGSAASRISQQGWGWNHLLIAIHFILFYLSVFNL